MSSNGDPRFYEVRNLFLLDVAAALARVQADLSLLDVRSGLGETLLHWFAIEYREDIVKALLEIGAAVDPRNHFGATPFLEVVQVGNLSMCQLLLDHGAAIHATNSLGEMPLMHAASSGKLAMCRFLLDRGASVLSVTPDGDSVLDSAVSSGKAEVVELILERLEPGTDINALLGDSQVSLLQEIDSDITRLLRVRGIRCS